MAKKSLRERMAETPSQPDVQESTRKFAMFLNCWNEVEKAFREGWSYRELWQILSRDGDIDFSYSSFVHYIRKVKRRQLDHEMERTRRANNNEASPAVKSTAKAHTIKPGSTKVDLPLFGQEGKARDPKRF